jgi:hypothetical protein
VTRVLGAAALLVGPGFFPGWLLTGSPAIGALVSPLCTAVVVATFASACVLLHVPIVVAVVLTVASSVLCAWFVLLRRRREDPRPRVALACLVVPIAGAFPLLTLRRPPLAHDAGVIWFFHAHWFAAGGAATAAAMSDPLFGFAHADYPPLTSAPIGAAWWLLGTSDLRLAQAIAALITFGAVSLFAFGLWWAFRRELPRVALAAAALVALGTYGIASAVPDAPATSGLNDVVVGAATAAAALLLLVAPVGDPLALRLGALAVACAGLSKNEGLVFALIIGVLACVRYGSRSRRLWPIAIGLAPALFWLVTQRAVGAITGPTSLDRLRLGPLLTMDSTIRPRIGPTAHALWHEMWPWVGVAALVTVCTVVAGPVARRRAAGGPMPWLWLAWLGITAVVAISFVASDLGIRGHLASAADRTALSGNYVLLAEIATSGLVAVHALAPWWTAIRRPRTGRVDRGTRDRAHAG